MRRCMLHVRGGTRGAFALQSVVCRRLHDVCCMIHAACGLLHVAADLVGRRCVVRSARPTQAVHAVQLHPPALHCGFVAAPPLLLPHTARELLRPRWTE